MASNRDKGHQIGEYMLLNRVNLTTFYSGRVKLLLCKGEQLNKNDASEKNSVQFVENYDTVIDSSNLMIIFTTEGR